MASIGLMSHALTERLREDILTERISVGSKLTEKDVCDRYGVSRTPAREAMRYLKSEGLIDLLPNRGAYVSGMSKTDLEDMFALRELLEVRCTCWAIERISDDELEELEKKYEFLELYTKREDMKKLKNLDAEFHELIHMASHNRILIETLSIFQAYVRHSALIARRDKSDIGIILAEHSAIFEAFLARDTAAGEAAVRVHIVNAAARAMR